MVTNSLIDKIVNHIDDIAVHMAVGTGAAPTQSSTTLAGENIRKIADSFVDGNSVVKELYLDETEGNGITFTNSGLFSDGTLTIGSGTLLSGGTINIIKNNIQSLTVSIEITVEGV